jgi:hypothetical protein
MSLLPAAAESGLLPFTRATSDTQADRRFGPNSVRRKDENGLPRLRVIEAPGSRYK